MNGLQLASFGAILLLVTSCGWLHGQRDFNLGVKAFDNDNFEAAIQYFESAAASHSGDAIHYNLALSHLARLNSSPTPSQAHVEAALRAVEAAQDGAGPDRGAEAKLHYIEGAIHALSGAENTARESFTLSLKAVPGFKPTLQALLKLEAESETALGRFALATGEVGKLGLEREL